MNLSKQNLARARKLALVAIAGTFSAVALATLVVPPSMAGVVPLLALTLPFIAASILESRIDRMSGHA